MIFKFKTYEGRVTHEINTKNYQDLADMYLAYQNEDSEENYLALCVEGYISNHYADHDNAEEVTWNDFTDCVASDVTSCNAPWIFDGRNKQITKHIPQLHKILVAMAEAQCKAHFDKEVEITPEVETKTTSSSVKVKATMPGVYATGTKKNPERWSAYTRVEKRTILIGHYASEDRAMQAKLDFINKDLYN